MQKKINENQKSKKYISFSTFCLFACFLNSKKKKITQFFELFLILESQLHSLPCRNWVQLLQKVENEMCMNKVQHYCINKIRLLFLFVHQEHAKPTIGFYPSKHPTAPPANVATWITQLIVWEKRSALICQKNAMTNETAMPQDITIGIVTRSGIETLTIQTENFFLAK